MTPPMEFTVLEHVAYNVFLPPKLPQAEQDESLQKLADLAMIHSIIATGQEYSAKSTAESQWSRIELMLTRLSKHSETPIESKQLYEDIKSLKFQDVLTLHIRAQNTGLIIRKHATYTTFEVFEVQAQTKEVMSIPGRIVRHFPGPVVQIPNSVADDDDFVREVANILSQMNKEVFDKARPKTQKAGNEVDESRDSINPNYFIQFFFGFLRGIGKTVDPPRVVKHIADEVLWEHALNPWRRSPIWLIVRVALQTSFDSTTTYKHFMAYYHANILSQCCKQNPFPSDLLYAMRVKMAKRLFKLGDTAPQFLLDATEAVAKEAQDLLQGRWDLVQSSQAKCANRDFSEVDFDSATNHMLPHSRRYLEQVFQGRTNRNISSCFTPDESSRLQNITEFSQYADGGLSSAYTNDPHLALFDFETSVLDNLARWTSKQFLYSRACAILYSCFQQYLKAAKSYYIADIADHSIMILTLMRIWMAIDELATKGCTLLRRYSPEFPVDILDPLLLRTAQHIEQARIIQQYIRKRHAGAISSNPSIFSDRVEEACFGVQYFRSSLRHRAIKLEIEERAEEEKKRKCQELEKQNAEYNRLNKDVRDMSCSYNYSDGWKRHDRQCSRCIKQRQRDNLSIQPHEWPLPRDQLEAELVVFELDRPQSFTIWRDITYEILVDLATPSPRSECERYTTLEEYSPLSAWLKATSPTPRITIASATKSFMRTHYSNTLSLPKDKSEVCLNNALQFRWYDKNTNTWAVGPFSDATFAKYGTFRLPPNSIYSHLGYALEKTTHSSNQVLADQHDCPNELSLHEHIAFGSLRSGARLQWMNTVRGLEEDILSFNSDEVWLLHTQAAWQIGHLSDDGSREWHQDLDDLEFGRLLVSQCTRVLDRVEANWLQAKSLLTIVTLINRLIASLPNREIACIAYGFLRKARVVSYDWLIKLLEKLRKAYLEDDIMGYQYRVCEMAIICRETYYVEPSHLDSIMSEPEDYSVLIEASIRLYDNQPPKLKNAPISLQILLCRDRRFTHSIVPNLVGLWQVLPAPSNRWIKTITAEDKEGQTQTVHLNLLNGRLLIDAKPIGRLPRQYVEHPTYIRLFGQRIMDVAPTKEEGMEFTTATCIDNHQQISFAIEEDSGRLIIQTRKKITREKITDQDQEYEGPYELIPHEMLSNDFPKFLSEDYHHWADLAHKTVEFRPTSSPWSCGNYRWILRFDTFRKTLQHASNGSFLVDIHDAVFKSLARSVGPLESDRYLHISRSLNGLVELDLPRMKLSFFVNDAHQIESSNFRDQVLDENQSAGTLFGLKNQLLLRAKRSLAQSLPRSGSVLIPDGEVSFSKHNHHVSVSVRFDSRRSVDVYRYMIDEDLGYLATDAGLTSRLFKIYLHALTSHCLPDPLTGRTGTEEALQELSQASTWSFEQIDLKQAELLKAIGEISPKRLYYPPHLECMETTDWVDLPSLSQHVAFSFVSRQVLRHANTLQLFHPLDFELDEYIIALEASETLLKRAIRRTIAFYPPDTVKCTSRILELGTVLDGLYPGRDNLAGDWEEAGQAASWASRMTFQNWGKPIFKSYELVSLVESWGTLNDQGTPRILSYRSFWFSLSLKSTWISLYNLLRHARASSIRYALSACLAAIAFGNTVPRDLIPVLLAFATNPRFQNLDPPSERIFRFEDEYEPTRERVRELISNTPFGESPAQSLARQWNESDDALSLRKFNHYHSNLSKFRPELISDLMNQWPQTQQHSVQLHSSNPEHSKWFNVEECLESTKEYFSSCMWNIKMKNHLQELEAVLSSRPTTAGIAFTPMIYSDTHQKYPQITPRSCSIPWITSSISSLISSRSAPDEPHILLFSKFSVPKRTRLNADTSRLQSLFAEFKQSESFLNKQYAINLEKSREELDAKPSVSYPQRFSSSTISDLEQNRDRCKRNLTTAFQQIKLVLSPKASVERVVFLSGVWPRVTPRTLLEQLCLENRPRINALPGWKEELIGYAQIFIDYQKSQRLIALANSKYTEEFYKELDLASGESDPGLDNSDWLLVQIDGNFGARSVQRQVGQEMISPSSKSNTVLQLNMGEGKSSVIIPMIASSLADSTQLVRVIVLKPLWRQMLELLVHRLSGLANRRIYYLPFGRHIKVNTDTCQRLRVLYEECMREGGILLVQPEHILSFKLMGIERIISDGNSDDGTVAKAVRDIQGWLETHARDILDESDEILHVRYQLVYTIGEQRPPDDHPNRWETAQQLLRLAVVHFERLHKQYPNSLVHIQMAGGRFPTLRIMPDCPEEMMTELVVSFAHNLATIDFFLSSVVFPKAAKEFPRKLATSSWDLANRRPNMTTGFSGTNNNRYLLPTSISQADPLNQLSTNALVLTYLLQPVNNFYFCMRDDRSGDLLTKGFLKLLVAQKPEIRVLLDVGTQMLELPNQELVRCWLKLSPDTEATVYFNEQDKLVILPRNGTPTPFITSPFSQRLDGCIIYLDDGHTRGTDLKLPRDFCALVTLGPKVTKDRLLQGCMRMRKLGHGQSVVFAAPPEIDAQIRKASPTPIQPDACINTLDILRWAMLKT
ncbi:RNA replication protein [Rhizoctonia solani]|uniref:ubiquitinyl hydrolase 1 n=1 Tax=Rhizoctonia solani TaxID=456999 RepID=A0A0K6GHA7_9AGAM|nr:RNA replication protein [Rhizoctonia solani]